MNDVITLDIDVTSAGAMPLDVPSADVVQEVIDAAIASKQAAEQADTSAVQAGNFMATAENKAKEAEQNAADAKKSMDAALVAQQACEATKAGWDNIMDSINGFNALGLYVDSEGYICQKE